MQRCGDRNFPAHIQGHSLHQQKPQGRERQQRVEMSCHWGKEGGVVAFRCTWKVMILTPATRHGTCSYINLARGGSTVQCAEYHSFFLFLSRRLPVKK
ncbi:hypothetical protein CDAR_101401 [Caerostris darwini]|uniref:Uncharacterized protein n=1 Tax=Caerostris darwini TaxID=1538125 RepID=A0AAV4W5N7_9ARAC|nr:hypothetical protein CDAR_101401 [Caerostris darwini]